MPAPVIALSPTVLHSIDPPGTNPILSFPFKPMIGSPTKAQITRAAENEPFQVLPRALIPNPYASLKPPVMHYGWEADINSLLSLAEELNCIVREDDDRKPSNDDDEDTYDLDDDDGFNHEGAEEAGDPDDMDIDPKWIGVRPFASMWDLIELVAEQLGIRFPYGVLRIVGAFKKGKDTIISLYTNYDLRAKIPPEEDIRRLADRLGISEKPKWYLDDMQWSWNTYGRQW